MNLRRRNRKDLRSFRVRQTTETYRDQHIEARNYPKSCLHWTHCIQNHNRQDRDQRCHYACDPVSDLEHCRSFIPNHAVGTILFHETMATTLKQVIDCFLNCKVGEWVFLNPWAKRDEIWTVICSLGIRSPGHCVISAQSLPFTYVKEVLNVFYVASSRPWVSQNTSLLDKCFIYMVSFSIMFSTRIYMKDILYSFSFFRISNTMSNCVVSPWLLDILSGYQLREYFDFRAWPLSLSTFCCCRSDISRSVSSAWRYSRFSALRAPKRRKMAYSGWVSICPANLG